MRHSLLFCGLLLGAHCAHGQQVSSDYILTASGDTIRGVVQLTQDPTSEGIGFTPATAPAPRRYGPNELRGFGLADGRRFVTRNVALAPVNGSIQGSIPAFLQLLVTGAARLYVLQHKLETGPAATALTYTRYNDHFYLVETDASPQLFLLPEQGRQALLSQLLADCAPAVAATQQNLSREENLIAAIQAFSTCYQVESRVLRGNPSRSVNYSRWYSSLGVSRGNTYYQGNTLLSKSVMQPGTGVALEVGKETWRTTASIGTEAGLRYTYRTSMGNSEFVVPSFQTNTGATLPIQARIRLNQLQLLGGVQIRQRGRLGLHATVGIAPGVAIFSESRYNEITTTYVAGTFLPTVITRDTRVPERITITGEAYLGVGITPLLTANGSRLSVRLRYGVGRSLFERPLGILHYNSLTLQTGLLW